MKSTVLALCLVSSFAMAQSSISDSQTVGDVRCLPCEQKAHDEALRKIISETRSSNSLVNSKVTQMVIHDVAAEKSTTAQGGAASAGAIHQPPSIDIYVSSMKDLDDEMDNLADQLAVAGTRTAVRLNLYVSPSEMRKLSQVDQDLAKSRLRKALKISLREHGKDAVNHVAGKYGYELKEGKDGAESQEQQESKSKSIGKKALEMVKLKSDEVEIEFYSKETPTYIREASISKEKGEGVKFEASTGGTLKGGKINYRGGMEVSKEDKRLIFMVGGKFDGFFRLAK